MTEYFDAKRALDDVLRRDHEATIAKADAAAADGDEQGRAWYRRRCAPSTTGHRPFQRLADTTRAAKMPWDEGFRERRAS